MIGVREEGFKVDFVYARERCRHSQCANQSAIDVAIQAIRTSDFLQHPVVPFVDWSYTGHTGIEMGATWATRRPDTDLARRVPPRVEIHVNLRRCICISIVEEFQVELWHGRAGLLKVKLRLEAPRRAGGVRRRKAEAEGARVRSEGSYDHRPVDPHR